MPRYCCVDDVRDKLPGQPPQFLADRYPSETNDQLMERWMLIIDGWIETISSSIDESVGDAYPYAYAGNTQKFPDRSSGTPGSIVEAAAYYLRSRIVGALPINREKDSNPERDYRLLADKILEEIRTGRRLLKAPSSSTDADRARGNVFTKDAFSGWGL